jgi:hypothetical protein
VVTVTQPGNAKYGPAPEVTQSIWIEKAPLTVAGDNLTMTQGSAIPALTWTPTGFVNGDTAASALTGAPALTTTATSTSAPGVYPIEIVQNALASPNYRFAFKAGTLTVLAPSSAASRR